MPINTLAPMQDYVHPPQRRRRKTGDPLPPEAFLQMDTGYRQQTPGYSEYATGAIDDLAPTPLDAASYAPFIGEAADAASIFSALQKRDYGGAGLGAAALAIPFLGAGTLKRLATEYMWFPHGRGQLEVIRNPTPDDYGRIAKEVRADYPDLMPGEPKTRFTVDEDGNRYIWKAYDAIHAYAEPQIEAKIGRKVSQHFDEMR